VAAKVATRLLHDDTDDERSEEQHTAATARNERSEARNPKQRLVCLYTYDFSDQADVRRVLVAMKELGLLSSSPNGESDTAVVYYKCDAYTYLDIVSQNEYKLRASMYNSRDMLKK